MVWRSIALFLLLCNYDLIICKKKKSSTSINFDSLISGMDPAEQEIFRQELQKEVKKFHIPNAHKKSKTSYAAKKRKLRPKAKAKQTPMRKMLPGICDPICAHQCVHGCDFRCCIPGYQVTKNVPRPPVGVVLPGSCSTTCSPTCFPECSPTCCAGGPSGMFQSALDLSTLFPPTCAPGCPETCFPFCTPSCCSGQSPPPQASQYAMPQAAPPVPPPQQVAYTAPAPPMAAQSIPSFTQCGGSCSQDCAPSCLSSCCIQRQRQQFTQQQMYTTPMYMQQQQPAMPVMQPSQPSCSPPCSPACAPTCTSGCCEGKEPQPPRTPQASRIMSSMMQQTPMGQSKANMASQKPQIPSQQTAPAALPAPADNTETLNLPEAPMFQEEQKNTLGSNGLSNGLFMKDPSAPPPDISDIKPDATPSQIICPLSCPDMCLPDCTTTCCNGNKPSAFEIDKKSKIAQQLALLKRRRRYLYEYYYQ